MAPSPHRRTAAPLPPADRAAVLAEAERLRRARVINAEGEQQTAAKLVEAGEMLARQP